MLRVDYNNKEWIERFITEVLTDEDFLNAYKECKFIDGFLPKLGYLEVSSNVYVFINENNQIETDIGLEKLNKHIIGNTLFINRYKEVVKKIN